MVCDDLEMVLYAEDDLDVPHDDGYGLHAFHHAETFFTNLKLEGFLFTLYSLIDYISSQVFQRC